MRCWQASFIAFAFLNIHVAKASPWVEPDDPMLRVNLQQLADAGYIKAPLTTFPLQWALLNDDLQKIDPLKLPDYLNLAYRYVKHYYNDARLGRGTSRLKMLSTTQAPYRLGYGSFARDEWGVYSSYEHTDAKFSFRVNANYAKQTDGDKKFNYQGSYAAIANGSLTVAVGELERWWGPGWQSSLSWSQNSNAVPAISTSWFGLQNPILGDWSFISLVGQLDSTSPNNYLWASRISSKPWQWLELGGSFQSYWGASGQARYDEFPKVITDQEDTARRQTSLDMRIQLPSMGEVSQGIYGQIVSGQQQTKLSSYLYGYETSWFLAGQQAHLVFERQKLHDDYWLLNDDDPNLMVNEDRTINDQRLATLWSAGGIFFLVTSINCNCLFIGLTLKQNLSFIKPLWNISCRYGRGNFIWAPIIVLSMLMMIAWVCGLAGTFAFRSRWEA
ncbi:capsule assembly Wzi family protein [Dongshaea marina]|uniref:capsule assembly Wzi family protein n=1 Tax=Dongshaea marina TaxID=2047966 RepID=UPI000D3E8120|nr:capsule assembly Wzi family protein [Dongshaea marina]